LLILSLLSSYLLPHLFFYHPLFYHLYIYDIYNNIYINKRYRIENDQRVKSDHKRKERRGEGGGQ